MRGSHLVFILLGLLGGLQQVSGEANATSFTNIFVFGASYSDSGNRHILSGGFPPSPPFFEGRFADGPIYADFLADAFGLSNDPFLLGGTNRAVGGELTNEVLSRVNSFVRNSAPLDPNALYILLAGGPDLRRSSFIMDQPEAEDVIPMALSELSSALSNLATSGARHFLVLNNVDLGRLPGNNSFPGQSSFLSSQTAIFNSGLEAQVQNFASNPLLKVQFFDTFAFTEEIIQEPAGFGFTNVTDRCWDGVTVCEQPNQYLFWDGVHPTSRWHQHLAQRLFPSVFTPIPEPSTLLLLGTGLAGLAAWRWKRGKHN